jgi:hypothetical protein
MDKPRTKRRGYSTSEEQVEANKRCRNKDEESKKKHTMRTYRNVTKTYITKHATIQELEKIQEIVNETLKNKAKVKLRTEAKKNEN